MLAYSLFESASVSKATSCLGGLREAFVILVLACMLAATTISAAQERAVDPARTRTVTVTAYVFSGVPDPSWRLNRKQIRELANLIDALQPESMSQPWEQPSKIGYRGFGIRIKQRGTSDREFFLYDNVMELGKGFGKRNDSNHNLEKWLLETAGNAITRHVRNTARNEIYALSKADGILAIGSVRVTLHIFSGVPDPSWNLTPEQAAILSDKIQGLQVDNTNARWEMPSRLGYRGFTIEATRDTGTASEFYLYDNVLQTNRSNGRRTDSGHAMESWLLGTAGPALEPDVIKLAEKGLADLQSGGASR